MESKLRFKHGQWVVHHQAERSETMNIVSAAKQTRDFNRGWTPSRRMRVLFEVPDFIAMVWKNEHGVDVYNREHHEGVMRLARDPAYRGFVCTEGAF